VSRAFTKYEGIGNDFIVVEGHAVSAEQAARLCDRHFGIGADGVLIVDSSGPSAPSMRVINADGSEPEMCGNGIRCVALHLLRSGKVSDGTDVTIETGAGPHRCRVTATGPGQAQVQVSMRAASLAPDEIGLAAKGPWVDASLAVGGQALRVTAVSMGNPHVVTFDDVGEARHALGPLLGAHESFARGVNVGFARMLGDSRMELHVLERGSGWTLACGTGACAAAVAAVETGRARWGEPISVELPGGALEIVVPALGEPVRMTGPARHVFDGVLAG
jgi:diaminopimelate epimerase